MQNITLLGRYEYGKPCEYRDGPVIGGATPQEYQPLYRTRRNNVEDASAVFPSDPTMRWTYDTVGANIVSSAHVGILHIPFVHKKNIAWAGITQVHKFKNENSLTGRDYIISRFASQVSTKNNLLPSKELLNPLGIIQRIIRDEPISGYGLNEELKPFDVPERYRFIESEWPDTIRAVEYLMIGVPIVIQVPPGQKHPPLNILEFGIVIDKIWKAMPIALRPWFSWGWNVSTFNKDRRPSAGLVSISTGDYVPPHAAGYTLSTDGSTVGTWTEPQQPILGKEQNLALQQYWREIRSLPEGVQQQSAFFGPNNIWVESVPYSANPFRTQSTLLEHLPLQENGYSMVLFGDIIQQTRILYTMRVSFGTLLHIEESKNWLYSSSTLKSDRSWYQHPITQSKVQELLYSCWKQWYKGGDISLSKLIEFSWEAMELFKPNNTSDTLAIDTFERFQKGLPNLELRPLYTILMLLRQFNDSPRQTSQKFSNQLATLSRSNTSLHTAFVQLVEQPASPLRSVVYSILQHLLNTFYIEASETPTPAVFFHLFSLHETFSQWQTSVKIQFAVLAHLFQETSFSKDSKMQPLVTVTTKTLQNNPINEIQHSRPSLQELSTMYSQEEVRALVFYIWNILFRYNKDIDPETVDWAWGLLLTYPSNNLKYITGSHLPHWLELLRNGLLSTQQQYPSMVPQTAFPSLIKLRQTFTPLQESILTPPLQYSDAWKNIAKICFTYFSNDIFTKLEITTEIQLQILQYFPKPWGGILSIYNESDLKEHHGTEENWGVPKMLGNDIDILINRFLENVPTLSFEAQQEYLTAIISVLQNLKESHKSTQDLKIFINRHLLQFTPESTKKIDLHPIDPKYESFIRRVLLLSNHARIQFEDIWNRIEALPRTQTNTNTCTTIFNLLLPDNMDTCTITPKHIIHLCDFDGTPTEQARIGTIKKTFGRFSSNITKDTTSETIDSLQWVESIVIDPRLFSLKQNLWDDAFSKLPCALVFEDIHINTVPKNAKDVWNKYCYHNKRISYLTSIENCLHYRKKIGAFPSKRFKEEQTLLYQSTAGIQKEITSPLYFMTFPNFKYIKGSPTPPERFLFLMNNWALLNSKKGKPIGILPKQEIMKVIVKALEILLFIMPQLILMSFFYFFVIANERYSTIHIQFGMGTATFNSLVFCIELTLHYLVFHLTRPYIKSFVQKSQPTYIKIAMTNDVSDQPNTLFIQVRDQRLIDALDKLSRFF